MPRSRSATRVALGALAACTLAASVRARAEWLVDVDAAVVHDSNLTRAANDDAIRGGTWWTAVASAEYVLVPAGGTTVVLAAEAAADRYSRYRDLDRAALGVRASCRHKLGLGVDVPYVSVALALSRDDYRGDLRDSDRASAIVEAGRRFGPALDAAIGASLDVRRQRHVEPLVPGISGAVFDLRGTSAWWRASYALPGDVEIGARADVRRGGVESTSHRSLAIFGASDAIAEDPAFGEDELYAYRLRGTTWSAGATLSWALSAHAAVNAGLAYELTRAPEGLDYRSRVARLSLSYSM